MSETQGVNHESLKSSDQVIEGIAERIDTPERNRVVAHTKLDNTPVHYSDSRLVEKLDIKYYTDIGLEPKYKTTIGDREVLCSDPFLTDGNRRSAALVYVKNDQGEYMARLFYKSRSQGSWRYMEAYKESGWIEKGIDEVSLNAPVHLQELLGRLDFAKRHVDLGQNNPEWAFYGAAKCENLLKSEGIDRKRLDVFNKLIPADEANLQLNLGSKPMRHHLLVHPERADFADSEQAPDLSELIRTWDQSNDVLGKYSSELYRSRDGKLTYMIQRDSEDRIWLGGVYQTEAELTDLGLNREWVDPGPLGCPIWEYKQQAEDQYTNRTFDEDNPDHHNGNGRHYRQIFDKYVIKFPWVQDYYQEKNIDKYNLSKRQKVATDSLPDMSQTIEAHQQAKKPLPEEMNLRAVELIRADQYVRAADIFAAAEVKYELNNWNKYDFAVALLRSRSIRGLVKAKELLIESVAEIENSDQKSPNQAWQYLELMRVKELIGAKDEHVKFTPRYLLTRALEIDPEIEIAQFAVKSTDKKSAEPIVLSALDQSEELIADGHFDDAELILCTLMAQEVKMSRRNRTRFTHLLHQSWYRHQ